MDGKNWVAIQEIDGAVCQESETVQSFFKLAVKSINSIGRGLVKLNTMLSTMILQVPDVLLANAITWVVEVAIKVNDSSPQLNPPPLREIFTLSAPLFTVNFMD